jgi:hypothetical protein
MSRETNISRVLIDEETDGAADLRHSKIDIRPMREQEWLCEDCDKRCEEGEDYCEECEDFYKNRCAVCSDYCEQGEEHCENCKKEEEEKLIVDIGDDKNEEINPEFDDIDEDYNEDEWF